MSVRILKPAGDQVTDQLYRLSVVPFFDQNATPQIRSKFIPWTECLGFADVILGRREFAGIQTGSTREATRFLVLLDQDSGPDPGK